MTFGPNTWLALAGYACLPVAWWLHRRERDHWPIVLLALCACLLRLSASLDPYLHEWDERYHAVVAKHLVDHPLKPTLYDDARLPHEQGSWAHGHVWLNKPPLSLWAIAVSIRTFGLEPWAVRVPSILLSAIAVVLLYWLACERTTRNAAFWAALLFAINGHLVELASGRTSNDHPDTFLVVFVLASLFAASRMAMRNSMHWAVAAGALAGCAFMSKSWPALIILPVTACFLWTNTEQDWRRRASLMGIVSLCAVLVALPWSVHALKEFPEVAAAASDAHWLHITEGLEDHARPWYYFFAQLPMIHGELAPFALLWFVLVPFRSAWPQHLALAVWVVVPFAVFSFAVTKMPGYTAIAAPAIFIIIGMAVDAWMKPTTARSAFRMVRSLAAAALIAFPLRFSWDRVRPLQVVPPRYAIAPMTRPFQANTVVTGHPFPIELMFHTEVAAAYDHALPDPTVQRLHREGFRIIPSQR